MENIDIILFILIVILSLILIRKNIEGFEDGKIITTAANNITTAATDLLKLFRPSYWFSYLKSDTRSKCFSCDESSKYKHGSNCIDCEIPGGRQVDPLLGRVATR
jgi:hypothetical protein